MTQKFRVNIDLSSVPVTVEAQILSLLSVPGSARIVSPTMVLEFTSYDDALAFAQHRFGESGEDAEDFVKTV